MFQPPLRGLIAATTTPMDADGSIRLDEIDPIIERLLQSGVAGFYVCGSTGEGVSLTSDERKAVVERTVRAVDSRATVLVQVGHNSLAEARELAMHAAGAGADVISATCPSYFKVGDVETLVRCMQQICQGIDVPFYYYHIPAVTASPIDIVRFMELAADQIPTLAGLKYTAPMLHQYQSCFHAAGGRFDIVWGCDEMLLGALATGAQAAIGSTYNIAAPLYRQIIEAVQSGDLATARELQHHSVMMVDVMQRFPFHGALKKMMQWVGMYGGSCRLPLRDLTDDEATELKQRLDSIGFFQWCGHDNR